MAAWFMIQAMASHVIERIAMSGRWSCILLVVLGAWALPCRAQFTNPEPAATTVVTNPTGDIFSGLFPSPVDNPYHGRVERSTDLSIFDPFLTGVMRYDPTIPHGQALTLNEDLTGHLVQNSPPVSASTAPGLSEGRTLEEQIVVGPTAPPAPLPVAAPPSLAAPLLIILGVVVLAILGFIELRAYLQNRV